MTLIEKLWQRTRTSTFGRNLIEISRTNFSKRAIYVGNYALASPAHRIVFNPINKWKNSQKDPRSLEIGPGGERIPGFETLDVISGWRVDYVADAAKRLPFPDATYDLVYASHILEHVPWYQLDRAVREWVRIIKHGGALEVWVPDGVKIARAFADAEEKGSTSFHEDGWWRFNPERDPCKWAAGRTFTYGDGTGAHHHHNWHRALFSARFLKLLLERAGLTDVQRMDRSKVRGHDHGWINLGMKGSKPAGRVTGKRSGEASGISRGRHPALAGHDGAGW